MHIRVITPISTAGFSSAEGFRDDVDAATTLSQVHLERGPASIECAFDVMLAAPETVARALEAERDGVDAVVIDCMADPGLQAAREAVNIPVLGPCETTMHMAAMLGQRFGVLTVLESTAPGFYERAALYGVREKLCSVEAVNIPVLELHGDHSTILQGLAAHAQQAIRDDGAHVLIFGCTGMKGFADAVARELEHAGYGGVPVIDPMPTTLRMAEAMVKANLRHSRRSYHVPPPKKVAGYDFVGRPAAAHSAR